MREVRIVPNDALLGSICSLLSQGKQVCLRAKGNSMRPFINGEKDILLINPIKGQLQEGDIALAHKSGKGYVVHRIVCLKGDEVILMGDGNLLQKEHFTISEIKGRVDAVLRNGKVLSFRTSRARKKALLWQWLLPVRSYLLDYL